MKRPVCEVVGKTNEVQIEVEGVSCMALIDTGSMITTVSEEFYNQHLSAWELKDLESALEIQVAGGHNLPYSGCVELSITIPKNKRSIIVPVLVVATTEYNRSVPIVVGTNVIRELTDHTASTEWKLAADSLVTEGNRSCNVYTVKDCVIPAKQSFIVVTRLGASNKEVSGVVTGEKVPEGLLLPEAAVQVSKGNKVKLQLTNLSDRAVLIRRRQMIGHFHQAKVVAEQSTKCTPSDVEINLEEQQQISVNLADTELSETEKGKVEKLIDRWRSVFATRPSELGVAKGVHHEIKLTDNTPFQDRHRRVPPGQYEEVKQHLREMLACEAIRRSKSPWSSNVVLVRKKDGSLRMCVDYRKLNKRTVRDAYQLPRIDETFDRMHGSTWFSSLDLQSGYWQVEVKEEDKEKTAFRVGDLGFYECNRMPFGLTNAPATFQRLMEQTLQNLPNVTVFIDDIVIFSSTFEEHLKKLEMVFERLKGAGLKLKPTKCHLFRRKIKYLGHVISSEGIETDPDKTAVIEKWPEPTTVQELRQALGVFGYYRRFIEGYSRIVHPLNELLKGHENKKQLNKKTTIVIDEAAKSAFHEIKERLVKPPILAFADFKEPFEVHTDASGEGLGAVLYQKQEGKLRVISYASRGLKSAEQNYSTHKLEFLALKWAITEKFYDYLYGQQFTVYTDNNPLSYVLTTAKLDATGHRWLSELSQFDFKVVYRSGKKNVDADALSRMSRKEDAESGEGIITADIIQAVANKEVNEGFVESLSLSHQVVDDLEEEGWDPTESSRTWRKKQGKDPVLRRIVELKETQNTITKKDRRKFGTTMTVHSTSCSADIRDYQ